MTVIHLRAAGKIREIRVEHAGSEAQIVFVAENDAQGFGFYNRLLAALKAGEMHLKFEPLGSTEERTPVNAELDGAAMLAPDAH